MLRIVENFNRRLNSIPGLIKNYTLLTRNEFAARMSTRLDTLLQYYNDEPQDPFNIYALAIEYQKIDRAKSLEYFDTLLNEHESYVPTYYHAAKLFQEEGNIERALATYEKGIAVARSQNDLKAARELKSAYDELTFDL